MSDDNSGRNNKGPGGDGIGRRREPVFSDFDDDEEFEESERDTDYASAYEEDELEALEDDDYDAPDDYESEPDWQPATDSTAAGGDPGYRADDTWEDSADDQEEQEETFPPVRGRRRQEDESEDIDYPDDDWEEEDYEVDEFQLEEQAYEEPQEQGWPVGLIVVALVALILLAAGGYGVIQQRAATQEEIRQLQAALATAAKPAELAASREALAAMEQASAGQLERIEALTLENRRLLDTVAGLESQLAALESSTPREPPAGKASAPTKPAAAKPAPPKPAASSAATGDWFVNFSSYSQRSAADTWAGKLRPSAGRAVVQPGSRDGKTFYRVRIVDLADRSQAEQVARQLQQAHGLPKLWVGMEQ